MQSFTQEQGEENVSPWEVKTKEYNKFMFAINRVTLPNYLLLLTTRKNVNQECPQEQT